MKPAGFLMITSVGRVHGIRRWADSVYLIYKNGRLLEVGAERNIRKGSGNG
jgi:hypothetical protein